MVNGLMWISDFSRKAGLSRETVRFYVRLGLLHPKITLQGGTNPYQQFGQEDLVIAELIFVPALLASGWASAAAQPHSVADLEAALVRMLQIPEKRAPFVVTLAVISAAGHAFACSTFH
jgi:MerR family regulatory protein